MIKYYLIGEYHGTKESPAATLEIIKKYNISNLALEFDKSYQKEIDEFSSGKRTIEQLTFLKTTPPHDGRASSAIKELLLQAKKANLNLYLVDSTKNPLQRDKNMAKNLEQIIGKTAYLCGNIHASKQIISLDWKFIFSSKILYYFSLGKIEDITLFYPDKKIYPCGSFLPPKETLSFKIVSYIEGTHYNMRIKKLRAETKKQEKNITKSPDPNYDFYYVVKTFTPSF